MPSSSFFTSSIKVGCYVEAEISSYRKFIYKVTKVSKHTVTMKDILGAEILVPLNRSLNTEFIKIGDHKFYFFNIVNKKTKKLSPSDFVFLHEGRVRPYLDLVSIFSNFAYNCKDYIETTTLRLYSQKHLMKSLGKTDSSWAKIEKLQKEVKALEKNTTKTLSVMVEK